MQDELGTNGFDIILTISSGGRAGVHEYDWVQADVDLDDVA